ncbi:MFS transporter [Fulvivirgaceae bacterium BMA12]|uniref:MFS transporter n=1 Tax=Agaribacillus aureus TaxID=3051825 RepID=A0ABT8L9J9_9BACT|nr:MFS transporter [Fulvivirgaceae bacterium BMA12]
MTRISLSKLALLFLSMLTIMAAAIIAPSIPTMADFFRQTPNVDLLSKLVVSLPTLFIAISATIVGRYIDRHGRLKLLYIGLVLYALSGISGFYLNNIYYILIGRALLGIAIGITMTITFTLIGDYFKGDDRKDFIGFQTAFVGFSGGVFLILGGVLADINWRLPFLIYLVALVLIPLVLRSLNEPQASTPLNRNVTGESNLLIRIIFINAILLMILFYIVPTQLPFLLYEIGIDESTLSGAALAINALGMVISSLLYARLKGRVHFPYIYTIAFLLLAMGYFLTGMTHSFFDIFIAMFIAGLGFGLLMANTNLWIMELSPHELRGKNIGMLTTCLFLGQFLSPIIFEPLVIKYGVSFLFIFTAAFMVFISVGFLTLGQSLIKMGTSAGS